MLKKSLLGITSSSVHLPHPTVTATTWSLIEGNTGELLWG